MAETQAQQNAEVIAAIAQLKSDLATYQGLVVAYVNAVTAAGVNAPADPQVAAALLDLTAADASIVAGEPLVTQAVSPVTGA